jgi:hypothetical protein
MSACKANHGMCGHEKMMIGMGIMMMLAAVAYVGVRLV